MDELGCDGCIESAREGGKRSVGVVALRLVEKDYDVHDLIAS